MALNREFKTEFEKLGNLFSKPKPTKNKIGSKNRNRNSYVTTKLPLYVRNSIYKNKISQFKKKNY